MTIEEKIYQCERKLGSPRRNWRSKSRSPGRRYQNGSAMSFLSTQRNHFSKLDLFCFHGAAQCWHIDVNKTAIHILHT